MILFLAGSLIPYFIEYFERYMAGVATSNVPDNSFESGFQEDTRDLFEPDETLLVPRYFGVEFDGN